MRKLQSLDDLFYSIPIIGIIFRRNYSYFKKHTAITNGMHVIIGVGLGLIIAGGQLLTLGVIAACIGVAGHIYAFVKG